MYRWIAKERREEELGPVKWVKARYAYDDKEKTFAFLEVPNGVHVLAEYKGKFALIRQFRPAIGGYVYELPGGGVEPGEEIISAARREMFEEIGLAECEGEILGTCRPSLAFSNEVTWLVYLKGESLGEQHLENDEDISVFWIELAELKTYLSSGKLEQASAFAALWLYENSHSIAMEQL